MTSSTPRVLVASDKFKGSLTAVEVAEAVEAGIHRVVPAAIVVAVPVADGGDGTLAAALTAGFDPVPLRVHGPTGGPVDTSYAVREGLAVIEMADCCGLLRLPGGVLQPMAASSRGLGEAVAAALDGGAERLVLGVGGSASTDGGAGMLAALGVRLLDASGAPVADGGESLADIASVDISGLHPRLRDVPVVLATDVSNPLLGEHGAAAIFGPQKGASPEQVASLEAALTRYAELITVATGYDARGLPGAGAAGGVGYAALGVLGATMRPGVEIVLGWSGFDELLDGADLVITGEGSLDRQTLLGKTPAGVAAAASEAGVPVVAVCGRSLLSQSELAGTPIQQVYALTEIETDPAVCMSEAARLLVDLSERLALDRLSGR